jgi:hypothetical protein
VIVDEDQLPLGIDPRATAILKLHGDLDHPKRLVFTEGDFDGFVSRNPLLVTYLSNLLITRTPLFVGYSLGDPDFRQIAALIRDRLGGLTRQGYVFAYKSSPQEIRRFERRDVKVIDLA